MQEKPHKALEQIEKSLKEKGQRLTPPRREVLSILLGRKKPMKAYDIVEAAHDLKPMSVYRALDFLAAQGLAHRIESLNAYVSCAQNHCAHQDSQYLICDNCQTVEELHSHAIDDFISKKISEGPGFKISYKTLELHGTCSRCQ